MPGLEMPDPISGTFSPSKLHGKLHLSRRGGRRRQESGGRHGGAARIEDLRIRQRRCREVSMIQDIEDLHAELRVESLGDLSNGIVFE